MLPDRALRVTILPQGARHEERRHHPHPAWDDYWSTGSIGRSIEPDLTRDSTPSLRVCPGICFRYRGRSVGQAGACQRHASRQQSGRTDCRGYHRNRGICHRCQCVRSHRGSMKIRHAWSGCSFTDRFPYSRAAPSKAVRPTLTGDEPDSSIVSLRTHRIARQRKTTTVDPRTHGTRGRNHLT
jgi:hypothetical protein